MPNPNESVAGNVFADMANIIDARAVITVERDGRVYTFAHHQMKDVTRRADQRGGKFASLSSLLRYVGHYGDAKKSALFYNEKQVLFHLDEEWRENGGQWTVEPSKALKRWVNLPNSKNAIFDQERLIDHLECWSEEVNMIYPSSGDNTTSIATVIKSLMELSLKVKISYDRKYQDRNNQSLQFQVSEEDGGGAENKSLPKIWRLNIPVIEGGAAQLIDVRLAYQVPRNSNEQPFFFFECPKLDSYMEQAVDGIREQIETELGTNWPLFKGLPT